MRIEIQRDLGPNGDLKVVAVEGKTYSVLHHGLKIFADARDAAMAASNFLGGAPVVDCTGARRHAPA